MPSTIVIHDQPLAFLWSVLNRANGTNVIYNEVYVMSNEHRFNVWLWTCNWFLPMKSSKFLSFRLENSTPFAFWFTYDDGTRILSYKIRISLLSAWKACANNSISLNEISQWNRCSFLSWNLADFISSHSENIKSIFRSFESNFMCSFLFLLFPLILICFCFSVFSKWSSSNHSHLSPLFSLCSSICVLRALVWVCIVHMYAYYNNSAVFLCAHGHFPHSLDFYAFNGGFLSHFRACTQSRVYVTYMCNFE